MKGNIYCRQKCHICGSSLVHIEKRDGFYCPTHKKVAATGDYYVKFGAKINKRFKSYKAGVQFLVGLRFETIKGSFDPNDYSANSPNAFDNLAQKYLSRKQDQKSYRNIQHYINVAINHFKDTLISTINSANIEDFLYDIPNISEKTRYNYMIQLQGMFKYCKKRGAIAEIPEFPTIKYVLGYRNITTWDQQRIILSKIRSMFHIKVYLAMELLTSYPALRPGDILKIAERDYNSEHGIITIKEPTKSQNKFKPIKLIPDHIDLMDSILKEYPGHPDMPIFRHAPETKYTTPNKRFGVAYLYKCWKKACAELGINNLDLYGGTKHTTVTEIARAVDELSAKRATGHQTSKAFERYCQVQNDTAFQMAQLASEKRSGKVIPFRTTTAPPKKASK